MTETLILNKNRLRIKQDITHNMLGYDYLEGNEPQFKVLLIVYRRLTFNEALNMFLKAHAPSKNIYINYFIY